MMILKNCRLISELTEGYEGNSADIVIEDGLIQKIMPAGSAPIDGECLDLQGKTVMPGLFDLHAHLNFDTMNVHELASRNEGKSLVGAMDYAKYYLQRGYTFIRECGIMYYAGTSLKTIFDSDLAVGPRMLTSGACNSPASRGNAAFGPIYKEFDGAHNALAIVREDVANGCDFIKYMASGAVMNEGGNQMTMICTKEELQAISDAAKSLGTYVACHAHGKSAIMACLDVGVGTIEHGSCIDEECISTFLKYNNHTALIPTIGILYAVRENLTEDIPEFMQKKAGGLFDNCIVNMKKAYEAGVRMGWGTDFDRILFEKYPTLEFKVRTQMGLTPIQILKMATLDSAKIINMDDKCGSVKVGKWADLIVIDGNPDENIDVMDMMPAYVFKGGKLYFKN